MVPTAMAASASSTTVSACRRVSPPIRRWAMLVSRSPRTSDQMTKASRKKVVTLMPPAVPAEPPPMNIRT